jgi:hemerythrin superfamily protein
MAMEPMDAGALLKADHRKVEGLFEKFESAKSAAKKQVLAQEICTELLVHAAIEEEIFYPACAGEVEDDMMNEAYVEHDAAKVTIAELRNTDPDDRFYDAKMKVLSEQIKHHVREEEMRSEGVFAQARAAGVDVAALGERMTARKKALLAEYKENGLPVATTRSFAGHELKRGEPLEEAASAQ